MVQIHPTKIIETEQGNIVMSMPDTARTTALSNSVYTYVLSDEDLIALNKIEDESKRDEFIKLKSLKRGMTMYQLTILSYVQSAPFHLNDYIIDPILDLRSFLEFADMKLIVKMGEAMKSLGVVDPLSI